MCPDTLGVLDPYDTERFCRDLVDALSVAAFRFPRPQRLRPRRGQHRRRRACGFPRRSRHRERAGRAGRQRAAVERGGRAARPPGPHDAGSTKRRSTASAARSRAIRASAFPPTDRSSARASSRSARASTPTATARTTSTSTNCFPSVSGASANTPWAKPRARPMS